MRLPTPFFSYLFQPTRWYPLLFVPCSVFLETSSSSSLRGILSGCENHVAHCSGASAVFRKEGSKFQPRNLKVLKTNALNVSNDFDEQSVRDIIYSYTNDWEKALDFFNWVENKCHFNHIVETYNEMIDILGKFFEFDLAWELIERMGTKESIKPDHSTFRILFKRYAAAHMVNEAIDTYRRANEFNLKDLSLFYCLVDALCEHKHVIEAQELCSDRNCEFVLDTKMYNMILRGWLRMGWWSKCKEYWIEMERKGIPRDLYSYSIYMDIMCKSGKPWKAIRLYKEMKKRGMSLDAVAYNTVIHAAGLSEGVDESIRLYREMIDLGFKPNVATYNTIIKLLCQDGRIRQAYMFLGKMKEQGCLPNVITYHCFFRNLYRPKEMIALFERMIEDGCPPKMETYVMLIKKFGKWGFLRPVFLIWDTMKKNGFSPDGFAYNALIDALLKKGLVDLAKKYDQEMLSKGLSSKPRNGLMSVELEEESTMEDHHSLKVKINKIKKGH